MCSSPLNKPRRTIVIAENQVIVKVDYFPFSVPIKGYFQV